MIDHYCDTCEVAVAFLDITFRELGDGAPSTVVSQRILGDGQTPGASDLIPTQECVTHLATSFAASLAMAVDSSMNLEYLDEDGEPVPKTVKDAQSVATRAALNAVRAAAAYDTPAAGYPAAHLWIESSLTEFDPVPQLWAVVVAIYETGLAIGHLVTDPDVEEEPLI